MDDNNTPKVETEYLLRSPDNAERLTRAIERPSRGEYTEHELIED